MLGLLGRIGRGIAAAPTRSGALMGGIAGAGYGAYNAQPGNRMMGAGIGFGAGVVGGGLAGRYGAMGIRAIGGTKAYASAKSGISSAMTRARGGINSAVTRAKGMFGPSSRSNAAVNSTRANVQAQRVMPGVPTRDGMHEINKRKELAAIQQVLDKAKIGTADTLAMPAAKLPVPGRIHRGVQPAASRERIAAWRKFGAVV